MKKNKFNTLFREHTKNFLSPQTNERDLVTKVYEELQKVLGQNNSLQSGSYARFTATTPIHDLDIIYTLGEWDVNSPPNPYTTLQSLKQHIEAEYINPTEYTTEVSLQTHSITISFLQGTEEVFSVDIVPAYSFGKNEFNDDTYIVPEILSKNHKKRKKMYEEMSHNTRQMNWVKTDPRGYITMAQKINNQNNDFRKTVKFIKAWQSSCKEIDDNFKLKSFHTEQVITKYFTEDPSLEIYDALFRFFCNLPDLVQESQIPDRADMNQKIDKYIDDLTEIERQTILKAKDSFLIKLEDFLESSSIPDLLAGTFYNRNSGTEKFLFDYKMPVLTEEEYPIKITGLLALRTGGFRNENLAPSGIIETDRKIQFRIKNNTHNIDLYKWKVKNDNCTPEPRGEISDHQTLHDPENTKYKGKHVVECYAIKNGVCVAKAKQNIILTHGI
ncbi:MAG: hypothetical protein KBC69_00495 [Candidatus Magasanikbacteria bacterium]|nr:hypothetical protein [Candidatus Magasanikbacteria bacterium]